jgi:hypothetical protein
MAGRYRALWQRGRLLAAALALCVAAAAALVLRQEVGGARSEELMGCDRLCQARNMILRAREALDNKAAAELMLLKVSAPQPASCCPLSAHEPH